MLQQRALAIFEDRVFRDTQRPWKTRSELAGQVTAADFVVKASLARRCIGGKRPTRLIEIAGILKGAARKLLINWPGTLATRPSLSPVRLLTGHRI